MRVKNISRQPTGVSPMPSTLAIRHLAACLRRAVFTTRRGFGQAYATSQLACVGRCSQPDVVSKKPTPPCSLSSLPAWSGIHIQTWSRTSPRHLAACLRGAVFTTRRGLKEAHATSQLACVGRCSQPVLVSYKPTPPRSLPAWSGVHNQTWSQRSPRHLAACLRGAVFPPVSASND